MIRMPDDRKARTTIDAVCIIRYGRGALIELFSAMNPVGLGSSQVPR